MEFIGAFPMQKNINWEKISVYLAALGFIFLLWNTQTSLLNSVADLRERIAKVEVKIEKLEK